MLLCYSTAGLGGVDKPAPEGRRRIFKLIQGFYNQLWSSQAGSTKNSPSVSIFLCWLHPWDWHHLLVKAEDGSVSVSGVQTWRDPEEARGHNSTKESIFWSDQSHVLSPEMLRSVGGSAFMEDFKGGCCFYAVVAGDERAGRRGWATHTSDLWILSEFCRGIIHTHTHTHPAPPSHCRAWRNHS